MAEIQFNEGQYILKIDFIPNEGDPARVFRAMDKMITTMQNIDLLLCTTLNIDVSTTSRLERVEAGSIKAIINRVFKKIDQDKLSEGNFKAVIGTFLSSGVSVIIDWTEDEKNKSSPKALGQLQKRIEKIAASSDLKMLPAYKKPSLAKLASCVEDLSKTTSDLGKKDSLSYEQGKVKKIIPNGIEWDENDLKVSLTMEEKIWPKSEMILVIKKADLLGKSM